MNMRSTVGAFLLTLASATLCLAHPGALDANGGHRDKKSGAYHQHRQPATTPQPVSATANTRTSADSSQAAAPSQPATMAITEAERTRRLYSYWQTANAGLVDKPLSGVQKRDVSATHRESIKGRDGGRCVVCGATTELEVDHRVALENGGDNSASNLATLCDPCHKEKTALDNSLRRKREKNSQGS